MFYLFYSLQISTRNIEMRNDIRGLFKAANNVPYFSAALSELSLFYNQFYIYQNSLQWNLTKPLRLFSWPQQSYRTFSKKAQPEFKSMPVYLTSVP